MSLLILTKNEFNLLNDIYSNLEDEAAFTSSVPRLLKSANKKYGKNFFSYKQVEEFLNTLDTHTLFKQIPPIYKRRNYRPFLVGSVNEQWQADLADMSRHKLANSNPAFLLCVIDSFSKYAFVRSLSSKHGIIVSEAFKSIFKEASSHPDFICTDFGKEFINYKVKQTLLSFGVKKIFQTTGNNKAAIVERFISTLRMIITKFLFHNNLNQLHYSDLQMIVKHYNNRVHSTTGKRPIELWKSSTTHYKNNIQPNNLVNNQSFQINFDGEDPVVLLEAYRTMNKQIGQRMKKSKAIKFQPGQLVRIANAKKLFHSRINSPRFTEERFKVAQVHLPSSSSSSSSHSNDNNDVVTFSLKGWKPQTKTWEPIKGRFYQHELVHSINRH